jgi:ribonuclease T1
MLVGWRLLVGTLWLAAGACLAAPDSVHLKELPGEAAHTLALIRTGGPFPYAKDGAIFGNFEKQLPRQRRGYYREYTVPTPGARNRGARRIVAGLGATGNVANSGEYYYTGDHYRTFRRIRE